MLKKLKNLLCLLPIFMSLNLSGCINATNFISNIQDKTQQLIVPEKVKKQYGTISDGGFTLPAIDMSKIKSVYWRKIVDYQTNYPAGTILVDTQNRWLYYLLPEGKAMRYGVGVGRNGLAFSGQAVIGAKKKWPHWSPTRDMMVRDPDRYGDMSKGMAPGVDNPLGARALYLYRDGKDTNFRIHGSHEAWSIGQAMSSGCIRMLNQDVIDLYDRAAVGTRVIVLSSANDDNANINYKAVKSSLKNISNTKAESQSTNLVHSPTVAEIYNKFRTDNMVPRLLDKSAPFATFDN